MSKPYKYRRPGVNHTDNSDDWWPLCDRMASQPLCSSLGSKTSIKFSRVTSVLSVQLFGNIMLKRSAL